MGNIKLKKEDQNKEKSLFFSFVSDIIFIGDMMKDKIKEIIPYVIILIIVILLKQYVFTTVKVNGSSMYPTLHDKDVMILDKLSYRFSDIKRFDIVVVDIETTKLIKRVIALPNETIEYKDNILYINGKEIEDKYNDIEMDDFVYNLGDDEYFVMGDNRGDSIDSRVIGSVGRHQIMGKTKITLFPLNRFRFK